MTSTASQLAASLFTDAAAIGDAVASRLGEDGGGATPDPFLRATSREDAALPVQHLAAALRHGDHRMFEDPVLEAAGSLDGDGSSGLGDRLDAILAVLEERYGPSARTVAGSVLHDGARQRSVSAELRSTSEIVGEGSSAQLARRALQTLLDGDPRVAVTMLLEEVAADGDVPRLYREVLTPCLREVGRLWQLGQVSVAQEHLVTSAVQLVMAQLYTRIFATPRGRHDVVVSTVAGELHAVGARMVADHFELAGWDSYYLGPDLPTTELARLVEKLQPDVVAVSAALPSTVAETERVVEAVRSAWPAVILVGGRLFDHVPDLWQVVGADGTAIDGSSAVQRATHLIGDS